MVEHLERPCGKLTCRALDSRPDVCYVYTVEQKNEIAELICLSVCVCMYVFGVNFNFNEVKFNFVFLRQRSASYVLIILGVGKEGGGLP